MRVGFTFLSKKFARRILMLFVICALIPITGLAFVSFNQVTNQLEEQSQKRRHQASKAIGMEIFEHLSFFNMDMRDLANNIFFDENGLNASYIEPTEKHKAQFKNMAVVTNGGKYIPLFGEMHSFPPKPTNSEIQHLRSGKALISNQNDSGGHKTHLFMRILIDPSHPEQGGLLGEIDKEYLWGKLKGYSLPLMTELTILDETDRVLFSTIPVKPSFPKQLFSEGTGGISGQFDWEKEGKSFRANYWSIFLKGRFLLPKWTVVLSESRDSVFAPMTDFKRYFILIVLLSVGIVTLISFTQIRRSLVPLESLQEGTQQIADRNFDSRVTVTSGDEFENLAESFNTMAEQLGKQFKALSAIFELDRAVLSSLDTEHIIDTILTQMKEVFECDCIGVTLLDPERENNGGMSIGGISAEEGKTVEAIEFTSEDVQKHHDNPKAFLTGINEPTPHFLEHLERKGMKSFLIMPLFFKNRLAGNITLGYLKPHSYNEEEFIQVRQFTDQVGVALSNSGMVKELETINKQFMQEIQERIKSEEAVQHMAYHDHLTGLPNRFLLIDRLNRNLAEIQRNKKLGAVLFLDLDNFKIINDTMGHAEGDMLLKAVVRRLSKHVRDSDTLARHGGDEFTIIIHDLKKLEYITKVIDGIFSEFEEPFFLKEQEFFVTISMGISVYPNDGNNAETLLKNADTAMYKAKDDGKNSYQLFDIAMNERTIKRVMLEGKLRKAIEKDELLLHYQPQIDIKSGETVGFESLLRWDSKELGLIPPGKFIPLAEDTGLIVPFGKWVLHTACRQTKAWQDAGLKPTAMAVNVSNRQFKEKDFTNTVKNILADTNVDPQYLELEVTESCIMEDVKHNLEILHELKAFGVKLSIDDFGTGYSSFEYLKNMPVNVLKIDLSFIRDITKKPDDAAIVKAIIQVAHTLKLEVVAEGVETKEQFNLLQSLHCDKVQGYLVSKPLPQSAEIERFMKEAWHLPDDPLHEESQDQPGIDL